MLGVWNPSPAPGTVRVVIRAAAVEHDDPVVGAVGDVDAPLGPGGEAGGDVEAPAAARRAGPQPEQVPAPGRPGPAVRAETLDAVVIRVGDQHTAVLGQVDTRRIIQGPQPPVPRCADPPQEFALGAEDLDHLVVEIGDIHAALFVHRQAVGRVQPVLTGAAPLENERPFGGEFLDAVLQIIRHIDEALGPDCDAGGQLELNRPLARLPELAEEFALGAEDHHPLVLSVGHQHVAASRGHGDGVGLIERLTAGLGPIPGQPIAGLLR